MTTETLSQLKAQCDQLDKEYKSKRAILEKRMAALKDGELASAASKIRALMKQHNLQAADLEVAARSPKKGAAKQAVAPKYRGPNGELWTGRGRQPRWLGEDREKFRIVDQA